MTPVFSDNGELAVRFAFLSGDDSISRDFARDRIIASVKERQPLADVERFNSEDADFSAFFERIATPSLLSPLRVFLVPDVQTLADNDFALVETLLDSDIPDGCVIFESDKTRAAKRGKESAVSKKYAAFLDSFDKRASGNPTRFLAATFALPPDYKMAEWVERNTTELLGRRIAKKDAEHLVDLVGSDTAILYSELTKVDLFLAPGDAVTYDIIDSVCGAVRQSTQFELAQALGEKNMAKTLEIIETMYTGSVYLPLFVGAVFRHFWSLFKVYQFSKTNPGLLKKYRSSARQQQNDAALALAVGGGVLAETQARRLYPAVIKPRLIDQAVSFTESQYKRIFSQLAEFDTGIKTGKFDDSKTGFQVFCYKIAKGA